jgi:protein tyrosine/serine phosphatase
VLLAGPHPVLAFEGLEDRIELLLREARVTHFVDLSASDDWMPSYRDLLPEWCGYTRYEIEDRGLPPDPDRLKHVVRQVIEEGDAGRIAYMHCQAGLGRTGTVVGVLLRELGFEGQDALEELIRLRAEAGLYEGSPEFRAQRDFIRGWRV